MGARFTLLIKQLQNFLLDFRIPACVHQQIDVNNSLIYTQVRDRWKASLLRQFCRILGLICHLIFGLWYECAGAAFATNIWSWLRNFAEQLLQSWHWKMFFVVWDIGWYSLSRLVGSAQLNYILLLIHQLLLTHSSKLERDCDQLFLTKRLALLGTMNLQCFHRYDESKCRLELMINSRSHDQQPGRRYFSQQTPDTHEKTAIRKVLQPNFYVYCQYI